MARARKTPEKESTAQTEFARYKERMEQEASGGFASPLPQGAIPVWSLQPQFAAVGQAPVPPPWEAGAGGPSVAQGLGTTIRLGVDALNAALSRSIRMMDTWQESYGHGCGCDECCGYDCCSVIGCGCCGCEPSVGTCC